MDKKSKNQKKQIEQIDDKKVVEKKKASISVEVETPTIKTTKDKKKINTTTTNKKPSDKQQPIKSNEKIVKKESTQNNNNNNNNNNSKNITKKQTVPIEPKNNNNKTKKTIEKVETKKLNEKRKLKEIESESEDSEEEDEEDLGVVPSSDEEDDEEDFDEIQADFDIVPCVDGDYHSIKNMIVRLIPYKEQSKFNAGQLTDLIIEQATKKKFGRSVHVDGTGDPYGFISILNYNQVKKEETIQGYLEYINEKLDTTITKDTESYIDPKLKEKSMKSYLSKLVSQSSTQQLGMIFCERFINIPNELAHPIYQFIQFDVELMQEKHNDKNYDFKNYLVLTTYGVTSKPSEEDNEKPKGLKDNEEDEEEDDEEETNKHTKKKSKLDNNKSKNIKKQTPPPPPPQPEEEIEEGIEVFFKCEDKYFKEHASAWTTFDIPYQYGKGAKWTLSGHLAKKGLIMIVPASKIQLFLNDLREKAILD